MTQHNRAARWAAILVLTCFASAALAEQMYGVDASTDSLYIIETDTGAVVTVIGPLHPDPSRFTTPVAMAVRPSDGAIFVDNNTPSMDNGLARVDPATGLATFVGGPITGGLAFDNAGNLYTGGSGGLQLVNTTTGAQTPVGGPSLPTLYGLDFNSTDGLLYGITSSSPGAIPDLLKIDPVTGALVTTIALSTAISGVPGTLVFESSGKLVGSSTGGDLFDINTTTGAVTNIRPADESPQGMGRIIGAGGGGFPCRWRQPWNKRRPPYSSIVANCANPAPSPLIAMDDFFCDEDARIRRVSWWGVLSSPQQANRPFYIAIYLDNQQCFPQQPPVFQDCVTPRYASVVGTDCLGNQVWRFSAVLSAPFMATAGQRYWLQISEEDTSSVRVGAEDFRWSAHRPVVECRALQGPPLMPLPLDPCDQEENDLSFVLRGRSISIVVPIPIPPELPSFTWTLRSIDPPVIVDSGCVTLDRQGRGYIDPEAEDGRYELVLYGLGAEAVMMPVELRDGEDTAVQVPEICIGDSNLDGDIDNEDIDHYVRCLLGQ